MILCSLYAFNYKMCSVSRSCPYDGDFKCNDGKCLRSTSVCNGYSSCQNEEDEQNCGDYIHSSFIIIS